MYYWADKQKKWDLRFLELAKVVASWSKDPSTKVGAVIANDKKVISLGFNGFPTWMDDKEEWLNDREEKLARTVHAEINALLHAGILADTDTYTLYTYPFQPCERCMVQVIQAGVDRCVYPKPTEEQVARWGTSFDKALQYAKECRVEMVEVVNSDYY